MKNRSLFTLLILLLGVPFFVGAVETPKTWDEANSLARENYAELVKENEERQAQKLVKNEESTTPNEVRPSSTDKSLIIGKDIKGVTLFITMILSILFTWGLGLIIPIFLRFVFLKRPVSKIVAIPIVVVTYFVQIGLAIEISGTNKGHSLLFLVAVVAYFIMRKGCKNKKTVPRIVKSKNI